ncbi:hypothetical protein [Streptomyces luteireticuli]|uniref:factor independent urate hydroxylase n=1 Tax=Streptomyces luteireticuli TaxID=173858 RepID=A0ABN0YQ48_9ACTN
MGHSIGDHVYGESDIEFLLVDRPRSGSPHRVRRFRADVRLRMDHPEVYRDGDNTRLVPVSSLTNSVLALGARHTGSEPEVYALELAEHFLKGGRRPAEAAEVTLTAREFESLAAEGTRHFTVPGGPRDHAHVTLPRDGDPVVHGGLLDVEFFVTGGATFTGFARDAFTTTTASTDRVFAARLDVRWRYAHADADHRRCRSRAARAVAEAFAGHTSRSSQHTFHHLGTAVLDACPDIAGVRVEGSHLTRALVDLTPFGVENDGRVYTASDHQQSTVAVDVHRGREPERTEEWEIA